MHASTVSSTAPKETIKTTTTTTLRSSTTRTRNAANTSTTATSGNSIISKDQLAGSITTTTPKSIITGTTNNATINNNKNSQQHLHTNANKHQQQQQPLADANHEIEEISKKISEHADAIYRTWKSRGLAPTELLEFYTNAAAATVDVGVENVGVGVGTGVGIGGSGGRVGPTANDFFDTNADVKTTEGLQKLVNTFVIKDKEQRGVKATSKGSSTSPTAESVGKLTAKDEPVKLIQKSTLKSSIQHKARGDEAMASKKIARNATNPITSTTGNFIKKNACVSNIEKLQEKAQTPTPTPTTTITKTTIITTNEKKLQDQPKAHVADVAKKSKTIKASVTTTPTTPKNANTNLNFNCDLNLTNVNDLSQLQTQNLQKIKELLQQEQTNGYQFVESLADGTIEASGSPTPTARKTVKKTTTAKNNNNKLSAVTGVPVSNNKIYKTKTSKTNNNVASLTTSLPTTNLNIPSMIDNTRAAVVVDGATKLATLASPPEGDRITSTIADKNSETNRAAIQVAKLQQDTILKNPKQPQQETINLNFQNKIEKTPNNSSVRTNNEELTIASSLELRTDQSVALVDSTTPVMEVARSTMPTPTKIKSARSSLSNGQDKNLGRPILTRGSVAERVLMFEKCPDVRNSFLNIKRPDPTDAPPKSLQKVKLHATPPTPPEQNSLQKEIRSTKSVYIPRFYFPHGKPQPQIALERTLRGILSAFDSFPNNQVTKDELPRILKLCGLPFYWRMPVMVFCQQANSGLVERQRFVEFWKQMNVYCHDAASRFVYILSRGQRFRSYILPEDLAPMVQDVVDSHPGLAFLKEATEFHSRYVHTVIARIFYSVNRSWSGRISIAELKKSDLLEIITMLEEEDDINQIMAFFSYEHFYVIYCKFWELDKDHDLLINQEDLARHSDHALSTRIVERIFSGCVTRSDNKKSDHDESKMSYTDFVWFLLSEEDKRTPTAIEYWFRCMDVDGDGVLSMYELEYFYEEQQQRMESIGIETLPFEDCLCQMLDMIKPQRRDCVTLGDLKRCRMTHVFFDTFFNLEKYLDHEQRDPFATQRDEYSSDWDRFAAQEYELLITEEND